MSYVSRKEGMAWYSSRHMPSLWFLARDLAIHGELALHGVLGRLAGENGRGEAD